MTTHDKILTAIAYLCIAVILLTGYIVITDRLQSTHTKVELLACYSKLAHYQP